MKNDKCHCAQSFIELCVNSMNNRTDRELYERELRRDAEIARSNANATSVLLIGLFVVALGALGAIFYTTMQQNQVPAPANQPPEINVELPEREAPQVQPPQINIQPPDVTIPDVNINVSPPSDSVEGNDAESAPTQPEPSQP
jgi:type IV secretory pathway VirB10-like protein